MSHYPVTYSYVSLLVSITNYRLNDDVVVILFATYVMLHGEVFNKRNSSQ